MGKYLSVILGLAAAVLGVVFLFSWWGDFVVVFKAGLAVVFIIGGLVALIGGFNEIKEAAADKKRKDEPEEKEPSAEEKKAE